MINLYIVGDSTLASFKDDYYYPRYGYGTKIKKYFKLSLDDILIVLDDIDMPKGRVRFRLSGSAGTHNGLRDIVSKVGETPRLRIGIDRDKNMNLADYVLSHIDENSKQILSSSYATACELIQKFIDGELCQDLTI